MDPSELCVHGLPSSGRGSPQRESLLGNDCPHSSPHSHGVSAKHPASPTALLLGFLVPYQPTQCYLTGSLTILL